jgi:hypothetical protein
MLAPYAWSRHISVLCYCTCATLPYVRLSRVAAGAFKHDTKLEVLKLGWCKVGGGEGARALADLLMFNNSLVQVRPMRTAVLLFCVV